MGSNRLYRVLYRVNESLPRCQKLELQGVYLDLIDHAEGIIKSRIREDYLHQCICNSISAVGGSLKGILKIGSGILDRSMTAKDDEACNADALTLG